ncbi:MAG: hypothetical protein ABIU09_08415 [Pyrinomonadaceae bacterium]
MSTVEIIHRKILELPPRAQEEVLNAIENIEERYRENVSVAGSNGLATSVHPLAAILELAMDAGVSDLADRHDFYAHGKLED